MSNCRMFIILLWLFVGTISMVQGGDPYVFFTWEVSYGTLSPMGIPQQVILINGQFPGPTINCTSNNNIVVNIFNKLDEPFLLTWNGIQHRKNSWQNGALGNSCPILPGQNFTYHFQPKDQIGSYFYYPTTAMHRAAGGFGSIRVHSRPLIPVPYPQPDDEHSILIGDWFSKGHIALRNFLDGGRSLARPDGVLINGKSEKSTDPGKDEPVFIMKPSMTYRLRICNVGVKASLNFRIQGHPLKLVEMEGSHVVQNIYESLDVHVGQCFSVIVTADKDPKDYYMIASTRFLKNMEITTKRIIQYENSHTPASPDIPPGPVGWAWSLNQFRSFRWNLTASAARPNPQGSYHYGNINITRTIRIINTRGKTPNGKLRYAINGVSHLEPPTPIKLAEYYGVAEKVFKYDVIPTDPMATDNIPMNKITVAPIVVNQTFRNFVEIVLENHEKQVQSWHLDGYSFFAVDMEPGIWSPEKRKNYNLLDAVSRHTIQVFPHSFSVIMLTFDNAGMWNLRSELTENRYLGQQLYISVLSPERSLRDEYNIPENALLCGIVVGMPKPPPYTI